MFKFDIKQGYHHIDIYKPHQKWEIEGGGCETCYFVFTVLPFGLTSALLIFTKVMRCLVKHWRINAIRINAIIENQPSWDSRVNLTHYEKATKKIIFWKNNINEFNKKP